MPWTKMDGSAMVMRPEGQDVTQCGSSLTPKKAIKYYIYMIEQDYGALVIF
jgi:hypothetical protein